ncbi:MAG: NAD(P)/FAD-dependent oxidoreductase [Leptolyngbyaceae cyanobacterium MO_188.B28]|nr:NAD(P)/FAD-dependent oxidoreductase [Leptolyngbyaceae cyanobacterium MO_188.B28]
MAVDYDLVIIGETLEAREASVLATSFGARVAIVEPEPTPVNLLRSSLYQQTFLQAARIVRRQSALRQESRTVFDSTSAELTGEWSEIWRWVEIVVANLIDLRSPHIMADQGVDVIAGNGQFVKRPRLAFEVGNRLLTARSYLLATGAQSAMPPSYPPLPKRCFTLDTFDRLSKLPHCPERLIVIGATPAALELAQTFNQLGSRVTVVTPANSLLPTEDLDVVRLMQAQLEADDVRLLLRTRVSDIQSTEVEIVLKCEDQSLMADAVLIASSPTPHVSHLNLDSVGVRWNQRQVLVNRYLQTTRSRIYACGSMLGGYGLSAIAHREAQIVVNNALFLPRQVVDYPNIPYSFATAPEVGRVGLTEIQAQYLYGDLYGQSEAVWVFKAPFKGVDKAQMLNCVTGFCKLIGLQNGKILGAQIVGTQASELVQFIALAMHQGATVEELSQFPAISATLSTVITQAADQWRRRHWQVSNWRRDWAENWFNWRRSQVR